MFLTRAQYDNLIIGLPDPNLDRSCYLEAVAKANELREIYLRSRRQWSLGGVRIEFRTQQDADRFFPNLA